MVRRGEVLMFSRIPIFLCHNNNKAICLYLLEWAASSASASHHFPARYQDVYIAMPVTCKLTREGRHLPRGEPVYSKIIGRIWQSAEITIRLIPVFPRVVTGPLLFSGVMTRDPLSISNIITMTCLQLPSSNTGPATLQSIRKICLI